MGRQAQFNHPELGGMGQWSQGGMIMIGDMFNQGLKHRVDALCNELTDLLRSQPLEGVEAAHFQSQSQNGGEEVSLYVAGTGSASGWLPEELGSPSSTGAQNDMRYACFPGRRRLAIQQDERVRVYDTGEHTISGFSQQQGGDPPLTVTSQFGLVRVADLALISRDRSQNRSSPASATPSQMPGCAPPPVVGVAPAPPASLATEDIVKTIERLAELRQKNILTEEEFAVKKAELLSRL
jgi:Short C-terminal domain